MQDQPQRHQPNVVRSELLLAFHVDACALSLVDVCFVSRFFVYLLQKGRFCREPGYTSWNG